MKKSAIFSLIAFILAFAFILANTTEAQAKYKKWEYFGKRCPSCYKKAIYKCMNCRKQDRSIHNWEAPICKSCLEKRKCIECKKRLTPNGSLHNAYICKRCFRSLFYDKKGKANVQGKCIQCGATIYLEANNPMNVKK